MSANGGTGRLTGIYDKLRACYGQPGWWPGTTYEIMTGAVLVQNTAWANVVKALANFDGRLSPEYVEAIPTSELREIIRPSGFYKAKSECLKAVTRWYKKYDCLAAVVRQSPPLQIRGELTDIKGIGYETADAIMLYAFSFAVFVVDAYTKRLLERLPLPIKPTYAAMQAGFESELPRSAELYAAYHSLILTHAKSHCRKKPLCEGCPLYDECGYPRRIPGK